MLASNPIPYKGQLLARSLDKQGEHRQTQPNNSQWLNSASESVLRQFPRREWCVEFVELRPGSMVVVVERLRDMVLVPRKAEVASAPDRASANTGLPKPSDILV